MEKSRIILLALLACMLSSCVMATQQDIQNINTRMDQQDKQIRTLNNQLGIGVASGSGAPTQAEIWAQFQGMRQDLNLMRGQLEDLSSKGAANDEVAQLRARVENLEAAVRVLSSQLAIDLPMFEGAGGEGLKTATTQNAPVKAAPIAAGNVDMAKTLYDSGTKAFSDRRYADAVKIFTDFINTYPKHSLISNAHFWQGESYYQLKNYSNAILSYQQVIEKYPGSNKLQSAMLKQGIAMYNRGQKDAAKVRLNELVKKYPKSTEATRAKAFMEKNT